MKREKLPTYMLNVFAFVLILAGLTSCSKTYCAQCVEVRSGYTTDEVCDTEDAIDDYINDLEGYNPAYPNQDWICNKSLE